jgi:tripartite ATP-independent transporter DctM subunit
MAWYFALLLLLGLTIILMFLRVPVAFAFFSANIIGAYVFMGGDAGLIQLTRNALESLSIFSLAPIPMFILMGEILYQTGLAIKAIDAVEKLIARVPGRLSIVTVISGTIFASLSGSSMASTALLGTTLMPEMEARGYDRRMAMGPILGIGGIAMLIPPSGMAVLLGSLSGISIAGILIAGVVPGILIALVYVIYIVVRCHINPALAPSYAIAETSLWSRLGPFLINVVPLLGLFVIVVGSILAGIATPSESAALGAVGALIAAAAYRSLTWKNVNKAIVETGKLTVVILFIIAASLTFSQVLAFSGATAGMLNTMKMISPTPFTLLVTMIGIVLIFGCFMEPLSILLITLPFFMPLAELAGFDLVWFGVLILLALEISNTTPPFGLLLFVMKGIAPPTTTMRQIYLAVAPFLMLEIAVLIFLIAYPQSITWLSDALRG